VSGEHGSFIDGAWETGEGEGSLASINPATGETIATVQVASLEQAERAAAAARRTFDSGEWSNSDPRLRAELLENAAELVERHTDELLETVVKEVGTPVELARVMQTGLPAKSLRWAAGLAVKGPPGGTEEALPPDFDTPPSSSLLLREPVGTVLGIASYNFPLNSAVWKLGPALAAGCTTILKPSEFSPLSTIALIRIFEQAGFPRGTVNMVVGDAAVGAQLTSHPDVDMVMFTGSVATGRKVMGGATESMKRLVLELGGKSAAIVLPGTDLEEIVGPSILRWVRNAGQGCGATTRTLVPRDDYERFLELSEAFLGTVAVGDPWDRATAVGPLIRERQREFVEGHVEGAVAEGARVAAGGGRPEGPGFYVNPTILAEIDNGQPLCQEELFGPVGAVIPYDTVEEAVALANDSKYGLHAAVYGPMAEAIQLSRRLRTGAVSVNGGGFFHPKAPWGGFKQSGFGREMGDEGYREFFQVKHVQWPLR
jgi:aldehyde dehydrogenase (NAD+)